MAVRICAPYASRSGAIANGGLAQVLMAANNARNDLMIYNPATAVGQNIAAAETLFVNFHGTAGINDGSSYEILPGGSFTCPPQSVPNNAISVIAATTGHRWVASES